MAICIIRPSNIEKMSFMFENNPIFNKYSFSDLMLSDKNN